MHQNFTVPTFAQRLVEQYQETIWRLLIIITVLALSAVLATRMLSGRSALVLLAIAPALILALTLLRRLPLGLLLLVATGLLLPISIGTGTGTTLNLVILLLPVLTGLWLLDMGLRRKQVRLHRHRAVYLLLALIGVVILSTIIGQLPWYSIAGASFAAQLGGLLVFLLSAAAFLLSAHTMTEKWLQRLVYLFLAIGTFYLVGRLFPPIGRLSLRLFDTGATGSVFWTWLAALAAGLALFHHSLSFHWRLGFAILAGTTLFVGITHNASWVSGWIPALVALMIIFALRYPRFGLVVLAVAAVLCLIQLDRLFAVATTEQSWWARRQAWQIVLDAARVNPVLGLGPANYYFYVQQANIVGWGGVWNVRFSSHNNYVDLIAQTGLIGLGVFFAFAYSIERTGWDLYRRLPNGFARAYTAACIGGLIATLASGMLGDWFLPFVYNIGLAGMRSSILFWIFLGGLLALRIRL